jgi:nucleotide-binding universal stress UspA family protein
MKIIAIITEAATAHACLDAALMAARINGQAKVEALHVVVDPERLVSSSEEVQIQRLREVKEGTAHDKSLAAQAAFAAWNTGKTENMQRIEWKQLTGAEEETIVQQSSDADLLVLTQGRDLDSGDAQHAAIRESGKPLLLVPADWTPRSTSFAHIAVALSDTPVTDQVIEGAMPWLRAADKVTGVRIGTEQDPVLIVVDRLREAGIAIEVQVFPPAGDDLGAQIVREAKATGADLLVAGAYRHNQLIEWLMGGTTRHMLAATELPLFLAH